MIALSLFLPMFFILPPRKIPPSPMGRIQDMGIQSEKARGMFRRYLPPSILPTSGSSRQVALPSRVRLVSLLASPSHIPARPVQLVLPPTHVALFSQRRGGGGQGTAISTPGLCIGTRRVSIHWHTPHTTNTHTVARGAHKRALANACGRASRRVGIRENEPPRVFTSSRVGSRKPASPFI